MSFSALKWAMAQDVQSAPERAVLCVLADHANADGVAWPSVGTIAERAGLKDRATRLTIKMLAERGLLELTGTTTNRKYRLPLTPAPNAEVTPARNAEADTEKTPTPAFNAATPAPDAGNSGIKCRLSYQEPIINQEERAPDAALPRKSKQRGGRLPGDWHPPAELVAWAERNEPGIDWRRETEKFRDYWTGKTGQSAVKIDWAGAWRNWLRNATRFAGPRGSSPQPAPGALARSAGPDWAQRIRAFKERNFWIPDWGPKPGEPFCAASAELLRQFGYARKDVA